MVHNFYNKIDKIYVLTISRNDDRHPSMQNILKGIPFEYWYGFDAPEAFPSKKFVAEIDNSFFEQNDVLKDDAKMLTIGQFGAYFSIKRMIDHIAESDYNITMCFEDDVKENRKDWQTILVKAISELPRDWDLLLAGYNYNGFVYSKNYSRLWRPLVKIYYRTFKHKLFKTLLFPMRYSTNLDQSGYSVGGHAFLISRNGAMKLKRALSPMRLSGDLLFKDLIQKGELNAYCVYPCLFSQDYKNFGSKTMNT